jgi:hypothetical protein
LKTASSSTVHSRITTVRNTGVIQQIPSSKTDFKSRDNSTVKVTFVSSNRDILSNYHVVGNIQNRGTYNLNMVARIHLYDTRMNEIDYQYSYASPDPVPAGSSAHFDVTLAQSDFANVVPKYFKLGFDW